MSDLFNQLYQDAYRREHAVIYLVLRLARSLEIVCSVTLGRLARSLTRQHTEFLADLEEIAIQYKMPRPSQWAKCPGCDDPTCPGAEVAGMPLGAVAGVVIVKKFFGQ